MNSTSINPKAFDAFAADYDHDFTHSTLGQLLRPRVWAKLAEHFQPGDHVLELACGTGEDAVWLAQQGIDVIATDGSARMVQEAQAKAEAKKLTQRMIVHQLSFQEIIRGTWDVGREKIKEHPEQPLTPNPQSPISTSQSPPPNYQLSIINYQLSGVFSNFGGLNTINQWQSLAESLAKIIKPGGKAILVPMGPVCLWEIAWYLLHGQPKMAFRRFGTASAKIGEVTIPIWYPSARQLRAEFAPWFKHIDTESLGLLLPPSYLDQFVERWPTLFAKLNNLEKIISHLARDWGDHYIITFERI